MRLMVAAVVCCKHWSITVSEASPRYWLNSDRAKYIRKVKSKKEKMAIAMIWNRWNEIKSQLVTRTFKLSRNPSFWAKSLDPDHEQEYLQ